jgi:hypothetical protein
MSTLVARHGLSFANKRDSLAFGSGEAPLMARGQLQARTLGATLQDVYGINVAETAVAVSELRRSQETAHEAGFKKIIVHAVLNEVMHNMNEPEWRAMIAEDRLPQAATDRAELILEDPPLEPIWITHGAIIAGLCVVQGIAQKGMLIPKFCEIRELPLETCRPS